MRILSLIPARMGSSRFPGKPMAELLGKPMIKHVYDRVSSCAMVDLTVVATCDAEIYDYINSNGGKAVMTSATHERASDRCAEALEIIEELDGNIFDIVVMVQGDEPLVEPEMLIEAIVPMLQDPKIDVVNLLGKIKDNNEFNDRNCIKVVCDLNQDALYFSREPIPHTNNNDENKGGKQVCIIPFRRDFLIEYTKMMPTPLEVIESVDMLRILEHGRKVRMVHTKYENQSVDTPEDLLRVEKLMKASLTRQS